MEEEFGADLVTITDDDGIDYEMEVLSRFECDGQEYMALIPADSEEDDPTLEVNILRIVEENGEEVLEAIQDDAELQHVYDVLMEQTFEEDDQEETD